MITPDAFPEPAQEAEPSQEEKNEQEKTQMKRWDGIWDTLKDSKAFAKLFADTQKNGNRLAGFVIEGWDEEQQAFKYLSATGTWEEFGDETRREDPKIYKTLDGINNARKKLEKSKEYAMSHRSEYVDEEPPGILGFKFWKHPESHYQPNQQFINMTGFRFPGSPRQ